jgi:integrase
VALQELFAVRRVPLAPGLVGIADGEALLAEMTAAWLAERPHDAALFPADLAAATGLRRGELFALRWSDVDFEARTIHVHASNYAARISDETKTEAGDRRVPLFPSIRQVLLERKARSRFSQPDDFLFPSVVGTPQDPGNFVRREFRPALRAAGLEGFRWHDLRHYAVSALIADGADIKLLQAIAGHATAAMTLDVYGHLMDERVTEAADRFDPLRVAAVVPR